MANTQTNVRTLALPRLKTRPEFQAVLSAPVIAKTAHFALHCLSTMPTALSTANALTAQSCDAGSGMLPVSGGQLVEPRLGAVTPKRLARRSVTRNALKRQIYSVCVSADGLSPRGWYVVRLRSEFSRKHFPSASSDALRQAARTELSDLWRRACT